MKINVLGEAEKYSSLAKINQYIEREIKNDQSYTDTSANYEINISHNYPPLETLSNNGYWITIQPWEFGAIPINWVSLFNEKVDEVWVPSNYVKNIYSSGGVVEDKVHLVPNGYDQNIFSKKESTRKSSKYKFLYVGGSIGRKGIDLLLKSFCEEFGSNESVELVIKDFGTSQTYSGNNYKDQILKLKLQYKNIIYIEKKLTEDEMANLYNDADCLVHPYRGEGFGMPILEAMACGLPVIVTEGGASDDFVLDGLGYKIRSKKISIGDNVSGIKLAENGWLLEPDIIDLKQKMRMVLENREEARLIGHAASEYVKVNYTWAEVGKKVKLRISEVISKTPTPIRITNENASLKNELMCLGALGKAISLYDNKRHVEAISECVNCMDIRPFHPEALLQMIEIVLDRNDYKAAKFLANKLISYTPNWDVPKTIYKKLKDHNVTSCGIDWPVFLRPVTDQRLSVCIITKNEESNIGRCLSSIRRIANQIIVVDTGSIDKTKTIAASYGAEVYEHVWNNDFSKARNKSLEYARGDWVLFLDADEELAPGASETLIEEMGRPNILGYRLPLENVGSQLHGCNYVPRLVRNAPGLHFIAKIHETIHASVLVVMRQWNMEQVIGKTKILHHGYKPEALESKNKLQRNLALYEEALEELPDEPSIMMNYAHDLNHDGQTDKAHRIYKKILSIFEQHKKEHITPEVREQFIHNYGVFLAQHLKMKELSEVMYTRTARETGPVTNVHYMAALGLMNCNKFREAIPELEASMEKAYDDTHAPCVPDVRTWKLKHLLANCHASVGNELKAIRLWVEVIAECDDSTDPFYDYARFLSTLERNKEALEILLKGLKVKGDTRKIWELGCGVVNKDSELAEMSLEWTEEALKHHPDSDVTNVRRGESLMKNGRFAEAVEYFSPLSDRGEKTATAAQLVCRQLSKQGNKDDLEIARDYVKEVTGWIGVLDKAPCAFDRKLAEKLVL